MEMATVCVVFLAFVLYYITTSPRCDPLTLVPLCDHVPDWQPRILLGMVEARSVNVKNTTTYYIVVIVCNTCIVVIIL